jgi:hypothetical protein
MVIEVRNIITNSGKANQLRNLSMMVLKERRHLKKGKLTIGNEKSSLFVVSP